MTAPAPTPTPTLSTDRSKAGNGGSDRVTPSRTTIPGAKQAGGLIAAAAPGPFFADPHPTAEYFDAALRMRVYWREELARLGE